MSLSTLPLLVMDQILDLLEFPDYRNLSRTCRSLHGPANRYLFRKPYASCKDDKLHYRVKKLHLRLTSINATYLREFKVYKPTKFLSIWKTTPLILNQLDIFYARPKLSLTKSHPDTLVKEVVTSGAKIRSLVNHCTCFQASRS